MKRLWVVGVDEVGRGPIAGPVTVGAFACERKNLRALVAAAEKFAGCRLKDSKKLSASRRALFAEFVRDAARRGLCSVKVASKSANDIDTKGIAPCIRSCAATCIRSVAPQPQCADILLDAGLRAPEEYDSQRSIVKGDEKESVIALASIVAKETRDAYMRKLAKKVSVYGFENHVGYGTRAHYLALSIHGFHREHRKSFLQKFIARSIEQL
jgi:ribonuclease HII